MKTIEQAAREHSRNLTVTYETLKNVTKEDFEKSFKAGSEFAQRWIPIEEEEPPLYITVLVKLFNGRYFTAKYIKSSKCREDDVWSDGFSYYPVNDTHWRPIELK